jgi:hypothetical protein
MTISLLIYTGPRVNMLQFRPLFSPRFPPTQGEMVYRQMIVRKYGDVRLRVLSEEF